MDTIADLLSQIKNAYMVKKNQIVSPWSKIRQNLAKVLVEEGYIKKMEIKKDDNKRKNLVLTLKYDNQNRPVVTDLKRVSKPGCRIYTTADKIPLVLGGMGVTILSTSKGLMTGKKARKQNIGGEVICQIY